MAGELRDTIWCYTTDPLVPWEFCRPIGAEMTKSVLIGSSTANSKTADVQLDISCPVINCPRSMAKGVWDDVAAAHHAEVGDTFDITTTITNDMKANVKARRTDSTGGWGMNLKFDCDCGPGKKIVPGAGDSRECEETLLGVDGKYYRGCQSRTRSGKTCQKWRSDKPHVHGHMTWDKVAAESNYCRNDGGTWLWCYTTDPNTRWEYCDPICDETLKGESGFGYRGCQTKTRSGKVCQRWDAQICCK